MEIDYIAFGSRIRKLRKHLRMSQGELAKKVGVSLSFMGHIERGTRVASMETLLGLSEALGVSTDYLIKGSAPGAQFTSEQEQALREVLNIVSDRRWIDK